MIDIKEIRENRQEVERKLKTKDPTISLDRVFQLDQELREVKTRVEGLKATRNEVSKRIGEKKRLGEDVADLMKEVSDFAEEIHRLDHKEDELEVSFIDELSRLPNLPMDDVKVSPNPADNVLIKEWGSKREWTFEPKNHLELGESCQLFDFKRAAKITGGGWPMYRGMGARLEWALINYMMSIHIKNGFEQWIPPVLVREEVLFGGGQFPKFRNQQFALGDEDFPLFLIPTAEIPLNGLHMDEIIPEEDLPLKYAAYTPCFRREAGAAGEKERGLIRVHQFNKVEMFIFCRPEESAKMFDLMMASAEEILEGLQLHHRSMLLVTGDMSYGAAKTVDMEVWLPGQNRYYEVSSISNCTDYQSRRSQIRFRHKNDKPELVHTLNGSGLATSRLMVSLLENNQNEDGSINIPAVLHPYLGGISKIEPKK
ncbi:MAG: serine--tRNA ligase [Chlamydiales bacterium]|nr:serine--tRNA ligase [Chlamydiales bacterium]